MEILLTILAFVVVVFVLILVHEWGHFITAKKTGMRVDEFAIGFPPKLFSYKKGETEYTINTLPIGGFVRIYGEDPTQIADGPDKERSFSSRPRWAQALVLIAGVVMNILLAWFLLVIVAFSFGTNTQISEDEAGPYSSLFIVNVLDGSVVKDVIPNQSKIISVRDVNNEVILDKLKPTALTEFIGDVGSSPIEIVYSTYSGNEERVIVTPQAGVIEDNPEQIAIGIATSLFDKVQYGFGDAIVVGTLQTLSMLEMIIVAISSLIQDTFTGTADYSDVAGPVKLFNITGDKASEGIGSLLSFTALISLNLAVINLLPIPALDGGRLLIVGIESVLRRPLNPNWTTILNLIGIVFILLLTLLVVYKDITDLFG